MEHIIDRLVVIAGQTFIGSFPFDSVIIITVIGLLGLLVYFRKRRINRIKNDTSDLNEIKGYELKILQAGNQSPDLQSLFKAIHDILNELIDASNLFIAFYDKQSNLISFPYYKDEHNDAHELKYSTTQLKKTLTYQVIESGKPVFADSKKRIDLFEKEAIDYLGEPADTWMGIPLTMKGGLFGVVAIQQYQASNLNSLKELAKLEQLAETISETIDKMRGDLHNRVKAKISEVIFEDGNLVDYCEFIYQELKDVIALPNMLFALYDQQQDLITIPYSKEKNGDLLKPVKRIIDYVIKKRESIFITKDQYSRKIIHSELKDNNCPIISIAVPLKFEDHVIGAISIYSNNNASMYSQRELQLLEFVSSKITQVILKKKKEEELKESKQKAELARREAETAKKRAQESERTKSDYLAMMSHEFRNHIIGILGMLDQLNSSTFNITQKQWIGNCRLDVELLKNLVEQALELSRLEAGVLKLKPGEFKIRELCDDIKQRLEFKAHKKGLTLGLDFKNQLPDILIGDKFRLEQILYNLMENALKFTYKGGVYVEVFKERETAQSVHLRFDIHDTGIGIPTDKLDIIFKSYEQLNPGQEAGVGLGLNIVKLLVGLHGGKLNVTSKVNKGSTFTIRIKYEKSDKSARQFDEEEWRKQSATKNALEKVLVVEDYNSVRESLVKKVQSWKTNIEVHQASNGADALMLVEQNNYSLILMDIQMPEMNGFAAAKYIRDRLMISKDVVPILGMTGSIVDDRVSKDYLVAGMDDIIEKPFEDELLLNKIAKLLHIDHTTILKQRKDIKEIEFKNQYKLIDISYYSRNQIEIKNHIMKIPQEARLLSKNKTNMNFKEVQSLVHRWASQHGLIEMGKMCKECDSILLKELPAHVDNIIEVSKQSLKELMMLQKELN